MHHKLVPQVVAGAAGRRPAAGVLVVLAALLSAPRASAHDTWFAPRSLQVPGQSVLALGTGDPYPEQQFGVAASYLQAHGCRQEGHDRPLALEPVRTNATSLLLRVRTPVAGALTCWAQLQPFELELEADKIALYLDEIDAPPATRQLWAGMAARGLPWKERYTKHARLEIAAPASGAASVARPVPMAMDVLLENGSQRLLAGAPLRAQVLRDGQPVAGLPVQLRGPGGEVRWLHTDAEGRLATAAPTAGRWLLRSTDLRLDSVNPERWDSRFVTLAFEVHAAR